jgi:protein subunit release factor A
VPVLGRVDLGVLLRWRGERREEDEGRVGRKGVVGSGRRCVYIRYYNYKEKKREGERQKAQAARGDIRIKL